MPDTLTMTKTDEAGCWTAREIRQQPETLRATQAGLVIDAKGIADFIAPLIASPDTRIILTGAGTSAFIGQSLAPCLSHRLGRVVEAIATTDIVSAPHLYLRGDIPTLLVSFGRSGNSPESLAAVELVDRVVKVAHHLIITCNPDGKLAARAGARAKVVTLPEATHDRAFAMTSSFSAMTLAALSILGGIDQMSGRITKIARSVAGVLDSADPVVTDFASKHFERVVYLGSGVFAGLAREAALKLMELSDGAIVTGYDTALGFRHGPKTIINDRTLVVVFISNDPLTGRYDRDILRELIADENCGAVVAVSTREETATTIVAAGMDDADDCDLLFPYVVPAQLLGLRVSQALGLTPDQPNRNGTVNRVVQGVHIHQAAA